MKREFEKIKLQIKSVLNVFDKNGYDDEAETYLEEIKNRLYDDNFEKILFCLNELCRIYNVDIREKGKSIANIGEVTFSLREILRIEKEESIKLENLKRFWTSLITWFEDLSKEDQIIKEEFLNWDSFNGGYYVNVNYDKMYKLYYGIPYVDISEHINFDNIKNFIELVYNEVLLKTGRLSFTIKINDLLKRFNLPFKLEKGNLVNTAYKTSETIEYILNYEQFERKIKYSEEMIVHNDIMDKHTALNYISDAFCYFFSIFKNNSVEILEDEKVIVNLASMVCQDSNSRIYKLVKQEIRDVKRIINYDYDIRHNEYYTAPKSTEKREILNDVKSIEYLYNRVFAILFLLRINYVPNVRQDKQEKNDG